MGSTAWPPQALYTRIPGSCRWLSSAHRTPLCRCGSCGSRRHADSGTASDLLSPKSPQAQSCRPLCLCACTGSGHMWKAAGAEIHPWGISPWVWTCPQRCPQGRWSSLCHQLGARGYRNQLELCQCWNVPGTTRSDFLGVNQEPGVTEFPGTGGDGRHLGVLGSWAHGSPSRAS